MRKRERQTDRFRDLPKPPKRSRDNYASALAETLKALDTAWNVAPGDDERNYIDHRRQEIKSELLHQLDVMEDERMDDESEDSDS